MSRVDHDEQDRGQEVQRTGGGTEDETTGQGAAEGLIWLVGRVRPSSSAQLKVPTLAPGLGSPKLDRMATLHTKVTHLRMRERRRVQGM